MKTNTLFGVQEDHEEKFLSLDRQFIKNKSSTFFFEMNGDSMMPKIFHQDYLIVDRSLDLITGRIVIVDIFGVRMCRLYQNINEQHIFIPLNKKCKTYTFSNAEEWNFFGVVTLRFSSMLRDNINDY